MTSETRPRGFPWIALLFLANVGALLAIAAWIARDPEFERIAHWQLVELGRLPGASALPLMRSWARLGPQLWALKGLLGVGLASLLGMLYVILLGPSPSRGARSWLILLTVCSVWLALAVGWTDLAWWGKQRRVAKQLAPFEHAAKLLNDRWPGQDGEIAGLGPFTAYPIGQPTTLLMLSDTSGPKFSAVNRDPSGVLRFALSGADRGDWLEWHPASSLPVSFTGGLGDRHELLRSAALTGGWRLVRYAPDHCDAE